MVTCWQADIVVAHYLTVSAVGRSTANFPADMLMDYDSLLNEVAQLFALDTLASYQYWVRSFVVAKMVAGPVVDVANVH